MYLKLVLVEVVHILTTNILIIYLITCNLNLYTSLFTKLNILICCVYNLYKDFLIFTKNVKLILKTLRISLQFKLKGLVLW